MADLSFTPDSRATIASRFLEVLKARHLADGRAILTVRGSYEWKRAQALGLELEQFGWRVASLLSQILPDKASTETLNRTGAVNGVDREQAVAAVIVVSGTGTISSVITPGSSRLRSSSGYLYRLSGASTISVSGGGAWSATFVCDTAGLASTPLVAATLQWDSTPANSNPTATVSSVTTPGSDQETDSAYAQRIIDAIRERPASGNRSDVRDWVRSVTGVDTAFVYPLRRPGVPGTSLGCWTAVPLGPADGDVPVYPSHPRLLSPSKVAEIADYIEGTRDKEGNLTSTGKQLRHVGMIDSNFSIEQATAETCDVLVTMSTYSDYEFEYVGSPLARSASTTSTVTVSGDQTAMLGKKVQLFVGATNARGGYVTRTINSAVIVGPDTVFTVDTMPTSPANDTSGFCVYGIPGNWSEIKANVFAYFDSLGPNGNGRWPNNDTSGATLSNAAVSAAVMAASGSKDATITASGATTPTTEFGIVTLRYLRVLRTP